MTSSVYWSGVIHAVEESWALTSEFRVGTGQILENLLLKVGFQKLNSHLLQNNIFFIFICMSQLILILKNTNTNFYLQEYIYYICRNWCDFMSLLQENSNLAIKYCFQLHKQVSLTLSLFLYFTNNF